MLETYHLSMQELETGMEHIRQSPKDEGVIRMIVCRPVVDQREVVQESEITIDEGLVGDNWKARGSDHSADGSANREAQLTIMNARCVGLVAQSEERWTLAGDQLYADFDLSDDNIPPGTQLTIGTAVVEVSALPHSGCRKFSARFGVEAMKFVNSEEGKKLHLRGINTRVVRGGTVRVGDVIRKV